MPPFAKKLKKPTNIGNEEGETKGENVVSAQLQKKIDKGAKKEAAKVERGVILLRHLPNGFLEEQLRKYFEQFGHVTRLRLARSRITGGPKGFAFVEFAVPEVAKIAAETMHNYLMFKKIVQAHYIPPEEQKYNYFKTNVRKVTTSLGKVIYVSGKTKLVRQKVKKNNRWNDSTYQVRTEKGLKKLNKFKKKYADLGVNFDEYTIAPTMLPPKAQSTIVDMVTGEQCTSPEADEDIKSNTIGKSKKQKIPKNIGIEDLLDETLQQESSSEDEDYMPNISAVDESDLSINSDSDSDCSDNNTNSNSATDSEVNECEIKIPNPKINLKHRHNLSKKPVSRSDNLINRKPNQGGIKKKIVDKANKKETKLSSISAIHKLDNFAAKEVLKSNSVKPIKKADIKLKSKKKL